MVAETQNLDTNNPPASRGFTGSLSSQSIYGTYPETYGSASWVSGTNTTITAGHGIHVHWGLSVPEVLASDAVAIEYSIWAMGDFATGGTGEFVRPFAALANTQAATGAIAGGGFPHYLDCEVQDTGNGVFITARGVAAFHGESPGVLGVSRYPVIGVCFGSIQGDSIDAAACGISLRRATLDETYPRYQDALR
jgi:hypothetical protein